MSQATVYLCALNHIEQHQPLDTPVSQYIKANNKWVLFITVNRYSNILVIFRRVKIQQFIFKSFKLQMLFYNIRQMIIWSESVFKKSLYILKIFLLLMMKYVAVRQIEKYKRYNLNFLNCELKQKVTKKCWKKNKSKYCVIIINSIKIYEYLSLRLLNFQN